MMLLFGITFATLLVLAKADTPANCTYSDAVGDWKFSVAGYASDCSTVNTKEIKIMHLKYPNIANDELGNFGRWTLIYNQGFEVIIANRKWLVMFDYDNKTQESYCNRGIPGYSHDTLIRQWVCFKAEKISSNLQKPYLERKPFNRNLNVMFQKNLDFVLQINSIQSMWKAVHYEQYENFTLLDLQRQAGGKNSINRNRVRAAPVSRWMRRLANHLPKAFDWTNPPNGQPSPVTPVRSQEKCGSCYAFASAAALEARIRLASNFSQTPIISPQDIVDCSVYSQGCDGGFPYLIAGKYAEDYGVVKEECNPYVGITNPKCRTLHGCKRHFATNYHYIGGYYGACNEVLMMYELVRNGPFPVGFEVYPDFRQYKSGVYHHTTLSDTLNKFDPFDLTNHAVTLVGYGMDEVSGVPFWKVKNSWGTSWGEDGFFRIRRGNDECGIESLGVSFEPVI